MSRRNPVPTPTPDPRLDHGDGLGERNPDADFADWLGERLRRVALGATAALLTARAFSTSEPDLWADAGGGLVWVLAVVAVAGLAVAGMLVAGRVQVRWSWADAGVIALVVLVGVSAGHAVDRRAAINLAWEWGGIGFAYLLVRNLPRTRGESSALAGALAATAVAVAVYGLYQIGVELPEVRFRYLRNKGEMLRILGVTPGSAAETIFTNRLMRSNEPFSTFALANSLAGFLVGPLVVMLAVAWDNLTRREGRGSRAVALALAPLPIAAVVACLTLTKSRSAYVGLTVGLAVLAWRERRRVRPRTLALAAALAVVVVAGIVAAGLASRRLDRQVLTESPKSLRYRQEYWIGAWRAINESSRSFWRGYGPGNFSAAYLRHKLPRASEEIQDPHDFALEVWATAGVWAVVALAVAVVVGLAQTLAPTTPDPGPPPSGVPAASKSPPDSSAPPASPGWLFACAGGGWVVVLLLGRFDLFGERGLERWLVLGGGWLMAAVCGAALWRRRPLESAALGAGALAVLVNLSAAGGIGVPTVALGLWTALALGLNLRDDRACGRLVAPEGWRLAVAVGAILAVAGAELAGRLLYFLPGVVLAVALYAWMPGWRGRITAFGLAAVWVALLGTFVGAVSPYWRAAALLADAEDALSARPPDFTRAEADYERAKDADPLSARPWLGMANLDYEAWESRGARPGDLRWRKIPIEMYKAVSPPRSPLSWTRHRERARMTSLLLKRLGEKLSPLEVTRYRGDIVQASRTASRLYPTNASLRAWLAEASAEIGMIPDALAEAREALRLDAITPHADKKLDPSVRRWLESRLPDWEASVAQSPTSPAPAPPQPKAR